MTEEEITAQLIQTLDDERAGAKTSTEIVGQLLDIISQKEPALCPYLYRSGGTPDCGTCEKDAKWASYGKRAIETASPVLAAALTAVKEAPLQINK